MHSHMRSSITISLVVASVLCAGCSISGKPDATLLDNPLYAEWYYKDLVENMMNLQIQSDPVVKDTAKKSIIDKVRKDALAKAQEATSTREQGKYGLIKPVSQSAQGQVLLIDDTLYFGPDTNVMPGPELHVYVTPVQDPLATGTGATKLTFPDASAIDLGIIRNPYGAGTYTLPDHMLDLRSVVLWDAELEKIYGFAQLQTQQ